MPGAILDDTQELGIGLTANEGRKDALLYALYEHSGIRAMLRALGAQEVPRASVAERAEGLSAYRIGPFTNGRCRRGRCGLPRLPSVGATTRVC